MTRSTCLLCATAPEGFSCDGCRDAYFRGLAAQVEALQAELETARQHADRTDRATYATIRLLSERLAPLGEQSAADVVAALRESLDGWEDAAKYKGDHLAKRHGDAVDIARLRKLVPGGGA